MTPELGTLDWLDHLEIIHWHWEEFHRLNRLLIDLLLLERMDVLIQDFKIEEPFIGADVLVPP